MHATAPKTRSQKHAGVRDTTSGRVERRREQRERKVLALVQGGSVHGPRTWRLLVTRRASVKAQCHSYIFTVKKKKVPGIPVYSGKIILTKKHMEVYVRALERIREHVDTRADK